MDGLIKAMNKLQDAFAVLGQSPLDLPQIAVVGGQSAGKSSVLENIVGRDFLPRGSGIVTRRPLVIKLITARPGEPEVAEFLHLPGQKFTDWSKVRAAIESATENDPRCANKGISNVPINLTICSPDVLNLTLIDLPGMTRVAVGDQPPDINEQIRAMLLHFITQENTIILAVTPANQDLANSDAIQLSKEVDPQGERTVGVLTKLDLMDRGTDALAILNNEVVPLKLGYIPVVNRSQHDINQNKDIKAQWAEERKYFETHPRYGAIAERCGTQFLARTLNGTLARSIRACLPEVSMKVHKFMEDKRAQLGDLAEIGDPGKRAQTVLNTCVAYSNKFREMMEGRDDDAPIHELSGGAKINALFGSQFEKSLRQIDVLEELTPSQLRNIIRNSSGLGGGLFIPDEAFQVVIRRAVRSLEGPALACVQKVYDELLVQALSIRTGTMGRYGALGNAMHTTARAVIASRMEATRTLVKTLIEMESALINTQHPDFTARVNLQDMLRDDGGGGGRQRPDSVVAMRNKQTKRAAPAAPSRPPAAPGEGAGAAAGEPVTLIEGWLEKKSSGVMGSRWTRRWCQVRDRKLVYNKDHDGGDGEHKRMNSMSSVASMTGGAGASGDSDHVVELDGCACEPGNDGRSFTLTPGIGKQLQLRCVDAATNQKWMHAVQVGSSAAGWTAFVDGKRKSMARITTRVRTPSATALTMGSAAASARRRAGPSASMTDTDILQAHVIEGLLDAVSCARRVEGVLSRALYFCCCCGISLRSYGPTQYFEIIRTKIIDSVPKAITLKLVNEVSKTMHTELVGAMYGDPGKIDELMAETPETQQKRDRLVEVLALMEQAMSAIAEVQSSPSLSM